MPGIIGKKIGMTRVFQDDGRVIPITVVKCEPNIVTQIKTNDKDGYPAVVLGFSALKKPTKNRKFRILKEFKLNGSENSYKLGNQITVDILKEIKTVKITGISKGKGFQGTIKRHHFSRGPETHGSHHHREPGSIGACAKPGRVHKGKKMAGRMGNGQVTINKIPVISINEKENLVALKGSIPGHPNSTIFINF